VNETEDQRIERLKRERDELTELADNLGSEPTPRSIDLRNHADEKHQEATQLIERQTEDTETIKAMDAPCAPQGKDSVMKSAEARGAVERKNGGYRVKSKTINSFTTTPATADWWGRFTDEKSGGFYYEPVAFWLITTDPDGEPVADALMVSIFGDQVGGRQRMSKLKNFSGFVYEPGEDKLTGRHPRSPVAINVTSLTR
jgi:hypothetical protein